jgi:hypothetical protein
VAGPPRPKTKQRGKSHADRQAPSQREQGRGAAPAGVSSPPVTPLTKPSTPTRSPRHPAPQRTLFPTSTAPKLPHRCSWRMAVGGSRRWRRKRPQLGELASPTHSRQHGGSNKPDYNSTEAPTQSSHHAWRCGEHPNYDIPL